MSKRAIEELAEELRGKQWTRGDARRVMRAWRESGERSSTFARRMGVMVQRLYWWRSRIGEGHEKPAGAGVALEQALAPLLLPVTVRGATQSSGGDAALVAEVDCVRVEVRDVQAVPAQWLCALLGVVARGDVVILLPRSVRIYVAVELANLRRSFEGLSNEVRSVLTRRMRSSWSSSGSASRSSATRLFTCERRYGASPAHAFLDRLERRAVRKKRPPRGPPPRVAPVTVGAVPADGIGPGPERGPPGKGGERPPRLFAEGREPVGSIRIAPVDRRQEREEFASVPAEGRHRGGLERPHRVVPPNLLLQRIPFQALDGASSSANKTSIARS